MFDYLQLITICNVCTLQKEEKISGKAAEDGSEWEPNNIALTFSVSVIGN